jgi:hypothetical protein
MAVSTRPLLVISALLLVAAPRVAHADESVPIAAASPCDGDDARPVREQECVVREHDFAHAIHVRGDASALSYDAGAGYMFLSRDLSGYRGLGAWAWLEAGADARAIGTTHDGKVRGAGAFGDARVSMMGDAFGAGVEVSAGAADIDGRPRAIGSAGVFMSFLYGELGYSYQVPLDGGTRDERIGSHTISLRITVPVYSWGKSVEREPMPK